MFPSEFLLPLLRLIYYYSSKKISHIWFVFSNAVFENKEFFEKSMFDSCFLKIVFEKIENVNYSYYFCIFCIFQNKQIKEPKVFAMFYVFSWFFKSKNSFQKP